MLIIGAALATVMGVVLGLLGGGGSILTVPILVYAMGLASKEAIATSLLVVAVTSAAGAIQHARKGNVAWRTGAVFAGVATVGAYGGGRLAVYFSGTTLLILFASMMVVTGVAMLRSKPREPENDGATGDGKIQLGKVVAEGLLVGVVTGLVGAGGGFLVVPALVLLGGMDMRRAVGTSLFVIALKSLGGLAGHLSHVSIDMQLASVVTVAAVAGSFLGTRLAHKISPAKLRRGFAWFVLAMAAFIAVKEAPVSIHEMLFEGRWPFWVGGAAIAAFVIIFLLASGRPLGVSTGFEDLCAVPSQPDKRSSWRLPFMVGIVLGGLLAAFLGGHLGVTTAMGMFDTVVTASLPIKALVFVGGGILIGFGTRLAGGCTSGHGIVGMAQFAPSSLIATGSFMASGFVVTNILMRVLVG